MWINGESNWSRFDYQENNALMVWTLNGEIRGGWSTLQDHEFVAAIEAKCKELGIAMDGDLEYVTPIYIGVRK